MSDLDHTWDVFISHAFEDKDGFVRNLAETLSSLGVRVWYDEFTLKPGDSISRSIDNGLARSRHGVVVLSQHFLGKGWTEYELRGLTARDIDEKNVIIPIWHGVTSKEVLRFSPSLADKIAINTMTASASDVAMQLLRVVRPDLYKIQKRPDLHNAPLDSPVSKLQAEISRASVLPGQVTSIWPMTILRANISTKVAEPVMFNDKACELYDVRDNAQVVAVADMFNRLRRWMSADDFANLHDDQERCYADLFNEVRPIAQVAIQLNETHPRPQYRNKSFFPVVLEHSREQKEDGLHLLLCILYIDESLPGISW